MTVGVKRDDGTFMAGKSSLSTCWTVHMSAEELGERKRGTTEC